MVRENSDYAIVCAIPWTGATPNRNSQPNILWVIVDDTGIAAWDTFGGLMEMPTLNGVADMGLRYTQWHTTALCSPTRSCLLTGRNAHSNGMACIVEGAAGYPGASAVIPAENGTLAEILVENGYSTYCVGKWHLTPETEPIALSTRSLLRLVALLWGIRLSAPTMPRTSHTWRARGARGRSGGASSATTASRA